MSSEKLIFSSPSSRQVNVSLEKERKAKRMSVRRLVVKMNETYTEKSYRQHMFRDSGNPILITDALAQLGLACLPVAWMRNYEVNRRIKEELQIRGWDVPLVIRKVWPRLKDECFDRFASRIYKMLSGDSQNGYLFAIFSELFGWPNQPAEDWLNAAEKAEMEGCMDKGPKRQADLPLFKEAGQ